MALLESFVDDEHWPDYGTLVLRDAEWSQEQDRDVRLDEDGPARPSVCGGLALAGNGWLFASARGQYCTVVLESHDGPPEDGQAPDGRVREVAETPYRSAGSVGVSMLIDGGAAASLHLAPRSYRVRVSVLRAAVPSDERGDEWRVAFWPAEVSPPRWLELIRPAPPRFDELWRTHLPMAAQELLDGMRLADQDGSGATLQECATALRRRQEWLDEDVLPPPPVVLASGHPDVDREAAQSRREWIADERQVWEGLAATLGVPVPKRRRDVVELLLAAGLLIRSGERLVVVPEVPLPERVLRLDEEARERDRGYLAQMEHSALAADLLHVALWSPDGRHRESINELAARVLADQAAVDAALDHAAATGLLLVERDGQVRVLTAPTTAADQPWAQWGDREDLSTVEQTQQAGLRAGLLPELDDWVLPIAGQGEGGISSAAERDGAYHLVASVTGAAQAEAEEPAPPVGLPPRHGVVLLDGTVVHFERDGRELRRPGGPVGATRALQTAHGVVVVASSAFLVPPDGPVVDLGPLYRVAVDAAGQLLAGIETHFGRRNRFLLHLVDLRDGSRRTMPWDSTRWLSGPIAFDGSDLLFSGEAADGDRIDAPLRWRPDGDVRADPMRSPGCSSSRTGLIATGSRDGVRVRWPDGLERLYAIDASATLTPDGEHLAYWRHDPPALTLWPVTRTGAAPDPRILRLPAGVAIPGPAPTGQSVWEDPHTILLHAEPWRRTLTEEALRLSIHSGTMEQVPIPVSASHHHQPCAFINPLKMTFDLQ